MSNTLDGYLAFGREFEGEHVEELTQRIIGRRVAAAAALPESSHRIEALFSVHAEFPTQFQEEAALFGEINSYPTTVLLHRYRDAFHGISNEAIQAHIRQALTQEIAMQWHEAVSAPCGDSLMDGLASFARNYPDSPQSAEAAPNAFLCARQLGTVQALERFANAFPAATESEPARVLADTRGLRDAMSSHDAGVIWHAIQTRTRADASSQQDARAAVLHGIRESRDFGSLAAFARLSTVVADREVHIDCREALARLLVHQRDGLSSSYYESFLSQFDGERETSAYHAVTHALRDVQARERREEEHRRRQEEHEERRAERESREVGSTRRGRCEWHVCPVGLVAGRGCRSNSLGCTGEYTEGPCECPR